VMTVAVERWTASSVLLLVSPRSTYETTTTWSTGSITATPSCSSSSSPRSSARPSTSATPSPAGAPPTSLKTTSTTPTRSSSVLYVALYNCDFHLTVLCRYWSWTTGLPVKSTATAIHSPPTVEQELSNRRDCKTGPC